MKEKKQILNFQTEVKQLLQLMINSLYSNKEIFLRELISNASDACDKLRFKSIKNNELLKLDTEFKIKITFDKIKKTLTISDNGIGMTKDEIILNLGTIAKSGTKEFFSKLSENKKKNTALIGQFGVGFYSGFIVADYIIVNSKKAGENNTNGVSWQSNGTGEFSVENIKKINRGTDVILHLKKNEEEFISSWKIKSIIKKYSNHISIPIFMYKEKWDDIKKELILTDEIEIINNSKALWTRNKSEISVKEYNEFYKNLTNDNKDPLTYIHSKIEGNNEYIQLFYIPAKAQIDIWDRNKKKGGIKLYIQKVFIMDNVKQIIPLYLRFVKGIIDSSNLPLNISREILQESKSIKIIKENSTKKILNMLETLAKNDKKYKTNKYKIFWENFGIILKEGIGEDKINKNKIIKLLRFNSTFFKKEQEITSLKEYIERMQNNQNNIFYLTSENYKTALNSPHLEIFEKKNIEVLILIDKIDEWMLSFLQEYKNKKLISITKGDLNLGELETNTEKSQFKKKEEKFSNLIKKIKLALKDKIKDVRITLRLTNSPSCLISNENDLSTNLIRILKASGQTPPESKQILEINPQHSLVKYIKNQEKDFEKWANILLNQAILAEGGNLENPSKFIKNLNKIFIKMINKNN